MYSHLWSNIITYTLLPDSILSYSRLRYTGDIFLFLFISLYLLVTIFPVSTMLAQFFTKCHIWIHHTQLANVKCYSTLCVIRNTQFNLEWHVTTSAQLKVAYLQLYTTALLGNTFQYVTGIQTFLQVLAQRNSSSSRPTKGKENRFQNSEESKTEWKKSHINAILCWRSRRQSCGMWRHIVLYTVTNNTEKFPASILYPKTKFGKYLPTIKLSIKFIFLSFV
jgi:hypothetical protein